MIESDEVPLGDGLSLVRAMTLADAPHGLPDDPHATVAVLALESMETAPARPRLRRLQTALRLWDDAEPQLGPTAHARTDGGPWMTIPLATGLRRRTEDCLLSSEEEDPLRAFCGARLPPHAARGRAGVGAAALRARLRARAAPSRP